MRWIYTLPLRLRSLFGRSSVERELDEELRYHVERQTEVNIAAGMSTLEARCAALRALDGVTRPKEECRDALGWRLLDTLMRDVKHAIRRLSRDWQFTLAAVLILALGIGVNTAVFSVVNAIVFVTQPFPDSERLVNLYQNVGERAEPVAVSFPTYRDIAASAGVFSAVAAVLPGGGAYQSPEGLQIAFAEYVTSNYLAVAGHRLAAGRWFTEAEDRVGAAPTVVIGYRTWQGKFGSDSRILGQTIRLNSVPLTVVGIGPPQLASASHPTLVADFWLPMSAIGSVSAGSNLPDLLDRRGQFAFEVRARLKDGVSVSNARAAMDVLARRLATEYPDTDPGKGISVIRTNDVVIRPGEQDLWMALLSTTLLTIVGLVLTIACSNLATLLLVRGTARAKEVSVRLALGATRWQLIRHFLVESVLLAACGALAGFVLSNWTVRSVVALIPVQLDVRIDDRVYGFTLALSLVTGLALGLAPALRSTRVDLLSALRGESTSSSLSLSRSWFTVKNVLLTAQVAGSFLLLMGTAYMVRMVMSVQSQAPDFAVQGVALVDANARLAGYKEADLERLYQELRRRIAAIPGVQAQFASAGSPVGSNSTREIEVDGAQGVNGNRFQVASTLGAPGFFETLQIPLLFGRTFQESDLPGRPLVAIVNETLARRVFGSANAVGRRFHYGSGERSQEAKTTVEIIGVVRNTGSLELGARLQAVFYLPAAQTGAEVSTFVARTSGDAAGLVQAMQREIRSLDPTLPVFARTMAQQLDSDLRLWRWATAFIGGMGVLALALASVGLYAVVRFAVSNRSVELGIRMALGAQKTQIVWLVMKEITILIGISMAIGSAVSVAGIAFVPSLIETPSTVHLDVLPGIDPITLLSVVVVMAATAGAAAYFPARRAAKADPSMSLRHQ